MVNTIIILIYLLFILLSPSFGGVGEVSLFSSEGLGRSVCAVVAAPATAIAASAKVSKVFFISVDSFYIMLLFASVRPFVIGCL